jgi:5-oxoprolinase (ATP-hydrolysing)
VSFPSKSICNSLTKSSSHLPDITLITPVFSQHPNPHTNKKEIIFFTASRGHHADVGGILPGSMPPSSVNIFEEGAEIVSFKIVNNGVFDRKGLLELLVDRPASYPGSSGCRNVRDVESDLKAVIHLLLSLPRPSGRVSLTIRLV